MYILGISAYYHDSAAALLKDGVVVAAIEEERFSRTKHDNQFPFKAIDFCLKNAKITIKEVDKIAYYEKPLLKFERILETFVETWPRALLPFLKGMPEWLDYKIKISQTIRKKLGFDGEISFIPHHLSHATTCFYSSPFNEAAILTIDGVGEYQTTGLWKGANNKIISLKQIDFPNSLGLLYSTFTGFLGFKINEDEYKLMGLSAYGKPVYKNKIYKLIDIKKDGSFKLDLKYFGFENSFQMWSRDFERFFGKSRKPKEPITQKHKDLAASIQAVTEEIYFKIINYLYTLNPRVDNLCLSGGVALNALANGKIYKQTPFKNVYIFGAASDSGTALGAALRVYYQGGSKKHFSITSLSLGSSYTNKEIETILNKYNLNYKKLSEEKLIEKTSSLLAKGHIIGWFQGRCEFGPRALGARSFFCRPNPRSMKTKMNIVKRREQFRPFAGSILQEKVHEYFDVPEKNHWSPFMTFCFPVKKEKRQELSAIVHKDNTCRIQTVNQENGRYYKLIKAFYDKTSIACILNTSFNLKGEPIVETPEQAIKDFLKTKMDYLVIEDFFL